MVIIPAKILNKAKSRLSPFLTPQQRRELSKKILLHVLRVSQNPKVKGQLVITKDWHLMQLARKEGAIPLMEKEEGLNNALTQATNWAMKKGAPYILILPSDLPFLTPNDVEAMISLVREERVVVLSPCRRKNGTNALLVKPPGILEYSFGEQSFEIHKEKALSMGITPKVYCSPEVEFDIDTEQDLYYYLKCNPR